MTQLWSHMDLQGGNMGCALWSGRYDLVEIPRTKTWKEANKACFMNEHVSHSQTLDYRTTFEGVDEVRIVEFIDREREIERRAGKFSKYVKCQTGGNSQRLPASRDTLHGA